LCIFFARKMARNHEEDRKDPVANRSGTIETHPPMKTIAFGFASLLGLAVLVPITGCFGDDSSATCEGILNCACYPNSMGNPGLCESPLVCVANTCVAKADAAAPPAADASSSTDGAVAADATKAGEAGPSGDATMGDAAQTSDGAQSLESGLPAGNLVTNGDFSMGTSYWSVVAGAGTLSVNDSMGCVAVQPGGNATLGWPEAPNPTGLSLSGANSYTLTYTAFSMTGGNVSVDAKVGQTMQPYTADFETAAGSGDAVAAAPKKFTHMFTPMYSDPSAGIAFAVPQTGNVSAATTVCFEDVSLVQN
jgi:hypothetical protein